MSTQITLQKMQLQSVVQNPHIAKVDLAFVVREVSIGKIKLN